MARARLQKEHARLLELQQRRDLAVTDLLALSKRLAHIQAEAQQNQQNAAQQQRCVRTQLLTLNVRSIGSEQGGGEIAEAGAEFGQVFASSVAFVIRAVAALPPGGGGCADCRLVAAAGMVLACAAVQHFSLKLRSCCAHHSILGEVAKLVGDAAPACMCSALFRKRECVGAPPAQCRRRAEIAANAVMQQR